MPGIVLCLFWRYFGSEVGRLCVCLCASVCVSPSMSILDQCEIEAVVIKRIRCFLMCAVGLCVCVWQRRHINVHKAETGETVCMKN